MNAHRPPERLETVVIGAGQACVSRGRPGARGRPRARGGQRHLVHRVRQDFSWIDLPVIGADGWRLETRGVAEGMPGLYFAGLAFQYAFASMLVGGAGRDAEYVARHIAAQSGSIREQRATARSG